MKTKRPRNKKLKWCPVYKEWVPNPVPRILSKPATVTVHVTIEDLIRAEKNPGHPGNLWNTVLERYLEPGYGGDVRPYRGFRPNINILVRSHGFTYSLPDEINILQVRYEDGDLTEPSSFKITLPRKFFRRGVVKAG